MSRTEGKSVDPRPTFGVGLTSGEGPDDYWIAIRVQSEELLGSARVDAVVAAVGGEADVQFVGIPRPFSNGGSAPLIDRVRPAWIAHLRSVQRRSARAAGVHRPGLPLRRLKRIWTFLGK